MRTLLHRYALLLGLFALFGARGAWAQATPNIGTTITAVPTTVAVGNPITLNLFYSSTGTGNTTATNFSRVVSGLPLRLTGVTFAGTGATGATYNSGAGTVTFPTNTTLGKNDNSRNFTISFVVPTGTTTFVATSTIDADNETNANSPDKQRSVTVNVTTTADLSTTLTAPTPNTFPNSTATVNVQSPFYPVRYANNGPDVAPTVTRTLTFSIDVANVGVNDVAGTPGPNGTFTYPNGVVYNPATRTLDFGTLTNQAAGTSESFNVSYRVPQAPANTITLTSNTTLSGGNAVDPNTTGTGVNPNSAAVTSAFGGAAVDVETTLAGPTAAPAGGFVTYTVTSTNRSATNATSLTIRVALTPTGLANVSASNQGNYDPVSGVVTFNVGTLTPGASVSRIVRVRIPVTGISTLTARASSSNDLSGNEGNNNGSAANANVTTSVTQEADVAVTVNGPAQTLAGANTTYNVLVTNNGTSNATGVTAQLVFTSAYKPASVTVEGGAFSYNAGSGVLTFTIPNSGSLAAGSSAPFTVRFAAPGSGSVAAQVSKVSPTGSTDLFAGNDNGSRNDANVTTTVFASLPQSVCGPSAVRSDFTFNGTTSINTYYPGVSVSTTGGVSSVTVDGAALVPSTGTPLAVGDLVMIMQMQGATADFSNSGSYGDGVAGDPASGQQSATAGLYEYGIVQSIAGDVITLNNALVNSYSNADASGAAGQQRFQVVRVPQYKSLTLTASITNVESWNGRAGGVLVLDIAAALNLNGFTMDLKGKGFRGGAGRQLGGAAGLLATDYRTPAALNANASKGEGIAGTPRYLNNRGVLLDTGIDGYPNGSSGRGAPGNAGGGGTDTNPAANDENTGGGGGSNAGTGGRGGDGWNSALPSGGEGGAPFLVAAPSRVIMGGGAGAGTTNNGTGAEGAGFSSSGAAGGGVALIRASTVNGGGTIDVSGADMPFIPAQDASGGGGAGGSVVLLATNPLSSLTNVAILARGGNGGTNTGGDSPHGPGGGGSGGVAFTSSATSSGSSSAAGTNGRTFGNIAYGATPGSTGTPPSRSNVTVPETPLIQASANCVADVTTTVSGPAGLRPGAQSTPYTVTFSNTGSAIASLLIQQVTLPAGATLSANQIASLPAGTIYTAPTSTAPSGSIRFPDASNVAAGQVNTFTFRIVAPMVTTSTVASIISNTTTTEGTDQGSDVAPNRASQQVTFGSDQPLPVELSAFEVKTVRADAQLSWTTATEKDNDHFDVERRLTTTSFSKIGTVKGNGTKTSASRYGFTDAGVGTLASGPVYYRLRQVDTNGEASYSPVRVVSFTAAPLSLSSLLYPVPAGAGVTLNLSGLPAALRYEVRLTDLTGRVASQRQLSGGQEHILALNGLAAGTYLVSITGADAQGAPLHLVKRLTKE